MASQHPTMPSETKILFDEVRWVIQIRHTLDEELEDDEGTVVSIFSVPKTLRSSKVEAYTPQFIALGPYHHWRPDLYEMERYKLTTAKRIQKQLKSMMKLHHLVDQFAKHDNRIRAHYHRYLDFNGETLAWMMVVDACFLLEFLQIYAVDGYKALHRVSSRMSHLVDYSGRKSGHNIILRDLMMLENQIPLFLLRKILECSSSPDQEGDGLLAKMLTGFMKEVSPFKLMEDFQFLDVTRHSHLLELLYCVLVPRSEEQVENNDIEEQNDAPENSDKSFGDSSHVKQLLQAIWNSMSVLNGAPARYVKQVLVSRPVKLIAKVPWKIITTIPGFSVLKQPAEYLFFSKGKEDLKSEDPSSSHNINKPPLIEEIMT